MKEFSKLVLKTLSNCKTFKCCESLQDEPCQRGCRGFCQCTSCFEIRQKRPNSARYFALQMLCWPFELSSASKCEIMNWEFDMKCWTGNRNCLKLKPFFKFRKLFRQNQQFKFWKFQELERESKDGKAPWIYHGYSSPKFLLFKDYVDNMQAMLDKYIVHLIALNFGNKQIARITDPLNPRLPIGDTLVGIDFSASPHFVHATMCQHAYQTTQTFGLVSFVSFWVTISRKLKKTVYQMVFSTVTHCTERICQALDCGLEVLEREKRWRTT